MVSTSVRKRLGKVGINSSILSTPNIFHCCKCLYQWVYFSIPNIQMAWGWFIRRMYGYNTLLEGLSTLGNADRPLLNHFGEKSLIKEFGHTKTQAPLGCRCTKRIPITGVNFPDIGIMTPPESSDSFLKLALKMERWQSERDDTVDLISVSLPDEVKTFQFPWSKFAIDLVHYRLWKKSFFLWIFPSSSPKYFPGRSTLFASRMPLNHLFAWAEFIFGKVYLETREREQNLISRALRVLSNNFEVIEERDCLHIWSYKYRWYLETKSIGQFVKVIQRFKDVVNFISHLKTKCNGVGRTTEVQYPPFIFASENLIRELIQDIISLISNIFEPLQPNLDRVTLSSPCLCILRETFNHLKCVTKICQLFLETPNKVSQFCSNQDHL